MEERKMVQVKVKEGTLEIPEDFILLNPEVAEESVDVLVRECRNHEKYGIPHFIYFVKEGQEKWAVDTIKDIDRLCCEKWPDFQEVVLDKQVIGTDVDKETGEIVYEETGDIVTEEWKNAPNIGDFPVKRYNSIEELENDWETPPYGVRIIPSDAPSVSKENEHKSKITALVDFFRGR